jgi:hypothetical protein
MSICVLKESGEDAHLRLHTSCFSDTETARKKFFLSSERLWSSSRNSSGQRSRGYYAENSGTLRLYTSVEREGGEERLVVGKKATGRLVSAFRGGAKTRSKFQEQQESGRLGLYIG